MHHLDLILTQIQKRIKRIKSSDRSQRLIALISYTINLPKNRNASKIDEHFFFLLAASKQTVHVKIYQSTNQLNREEFFS